MKDQTQSNQQYWEREALFNPTHNPEHTTLIELSRGYTDLKQGTWSNNPRNDQSSESETEETEAGDEDTNHNLTLTNPNNYTLNKANENNENTQTPPRHNPTPEQRSYQTQPNSPRNEYPIQNITTTTNQINSTPQTNNSITNHNPIPPNPERNMAGDARRTGNQGGPPQCTLAAARNIIRNETLSEKELATWCEDANIQKPRWTNFLNNKCIQLGEIAVGADRDIAHRTGRDQIRSAIEVSTIRGSTWSHAITYINNGKGTFRRYDNDDQARLEGTYTTVTWDEIIHTWDKNTSLFAIVPIDSELANARNVTVANEREKIRRRREELRNEGMERPQILHIIREEEKRARENEAYQTATNRTATNNPTHLRNHANTSTIATTIRSRRDSPPIEKNNGLTHDPNDALPVDTQRNPLHDNGMTIQQPHMQTTQHI